MNDFQTNKVKTLNTNIVVFNVFLEIYIINMTRIRKQDCKRLYWYKW